MQRCVIIPHHFGVELWKNELKDIGMSLEFMRENLSTTMFRDLIQMAEIKGFTQGLVNCWLSYIVSQPVRFDLDILMIFLMEYIGVMAILEMMRANQVHSLTSESVIQRNEPDHQVIQTPSPF